MNQILVHAKHEGGSGSLYHRVLWLQRVLPTVAIKVGLA